MSRRTQIISRRIVLRRLDMEAGVLDRMEELQIVVPVYRQGRERAYSLEDVDRLRVYQVMVRELGVNPAGAEVILRMRNQILRVRQHLAMLLCEIRAHGLLEELRGILSSLDDEL